MPKPNKRATSIIDICADAREKYQPDDGTTYCNLAVQYVTKNYAEYTGFINNGSPMLANQMIKHMDDAPEWAEVDPEAAKKLADDGRIVVAGKRRNPHGHVAVVLPMGPMCASKKWGGAWPTVSNVGLENRICGVNFAFSAKPKFYALIDES